jgi:cold-inducible RNA-binding protein
MRIYVGNLSYDTTEDELRKEFSAFGEVASVSVVTDRYSGRSKGFAFVEMNNKAEADAAIAGLNGKAVKERTLVVNEARPRTESGGRSSGGYGGGGYGGGGYGDKRGGGYGDKRGGRDSRQGGRR